MDPTMDYMPFLAFLCLPCPKLNGAKKRDPGNEEMAPAFARVTMGTLGAPDKI